MNWIPNGDKCLWRGKGRIHFHLSQSLQGSLGERGHSPKSRQEANNWDFSKFCVGECGSSGPLDPYKESLAPTCQLFSTGFHWTLMRHWGQPRPERAPWHMGLVEVWRGRKAILRIRYVSMLSLTQVQVAGSCKWGTASWSAWPAIGHHRRGGVNNRHLFLMVLESGKSKVRAPADSVPSEGLLPGCFLIWWREKAFWYLFL